MLPAAGLIAYLLNAASIEAREAAHRQVRALALETAATLELILRDNEALLARLAERPRVRALDARDCDPIIAEFVFLHPEYTTLGLRDLDANPVCTFLRHPPGADVVGAYPWFGAGLRSEGFSTSEVFRGTQTGRWVSILTYPVRDAQDKVAGLLLVSLDLLKLQERVLRSLPDQAMVVAYDRGNHFLMRSLKPTEWIGKPLPRAQLEQLPAMGEALFRLTGVDGITRLNAGAVVPSSGWRVYAGLPEDLVYAAYRERLRHSVALGAAVLLLALGLAYRFASSIAQPVVDLARSATDLAQGGRPAQPPTPGATEIDTVASGLQRLASERAAVSAHYEQILRFARDIVLLVDRSGNIVEANEAAVAAYGYSADELRGKHVRELRPAQAQPATEQDFQAAAHPGGTLFETVHQRKDGSTFPVEVSARVIDIDGQPYRQSFVRDISQRKAEEAARRQADAEARAALARFEAVFLGAPEPMSISELETGRLLLLNDAFCANSGYAREQLVGRSALELGLWTDPSLRDAIVAALRRGETVRGVQAQMRRQSGEVRDVIFSGEAIAFGNDTRLLLMLTDITEHKRAEQKSREQLDELLRWQELMLGREERMQQLKAEVNELLARLGQPARYATAAESKDDA